MLKTIVATLQSDGSIIKQSYTGNYYTKPNVNNFFFVGYKAFNKKFNWPVKEIRTM